MQSAFDEGMLVFAVFCEVLLFDAARIGADAHRDAMALYAVGDRTYPVVPADIAGVYAHLVAAVFDGGDGEFIGKMYVRHEGDVYCVPDRAYSTGVGIVENGDAHYVAPRLFEGEYLRDGADDVGRLGGAHGLYFYAVTAAYEHTAAIYGFCLSFHIIKKLKAVCTAFEKVMFCCRRFTFCRPSFFAALP